jgi:hypothetical protein
VEVLSLVQWPLNLTSASSRELAGDVYSSGSLLAQRSCALTVSPRAGAVAGRSV